MQGSGDSRDPNETLAQAVPGQIVLNRYRLERILGRGGFGIVWLARDTELEMEVAIKFLSEHIVSNPEAIDDLKRETRYSLKLTHPNIVRIYGFIQGAGFAGVAMEYVDGGTLSALKIQRPNRCFDVETLAPLVEKLCDALYYAHTKVKIAHRDMKPSNLMVDSHGELKVADFGISRSIADTQTALTRISTSGTPAFMSPQQLMGEPTRVTDDIYSVGATLFDLLAGKPPFYQGDVIEQLRSARPSSIAQRRADLGIEGAPVPREWEETIAACLEKEPDRRPRDAADVADRLGLRTPASRIMTPLGVATSEGPVEPTSGRSTPPDNRLSTPQGTVRIPATADRDSRQSGTGESGARESGSRESRSRESSARDSADAGRDLAPVGQYRGSDAPRSAKHLAKQETDTSRRRVPSRAFIYAGGAAALLAAVIFVVVQFAGGDRSETDESLANGGRTQSEDSRGSQHEGANAPNPSGSDTPRSSEDESNSANPDQDPASNTSGAAERIRVIDAALAVNDFDGAERELAELRAEIPGDPRLVQFAELIEEGRDVLELRKRVNRQLADRDFAAANATIGRLLRLRPDDVEARAWRREVAEKLDETQSGATDSRTSDPPRSDSHSDPGSQTAGSVTSSDPPPDSRANTGTSSATDPTPGDPKTGGVDVERGSGDGTRTTDPPASGGDAGADVASASRHAIALMVSSYHRTLQDLDIESFAALWLDPGKTRSEFSRAFRDVKSQTIQLTEAPRIELSGDQAVVRLRDRRRQVMQVGPTFENEFEVLMRMRQAGGAWKIEKVELRARS